ncbi:MAG TPA: hypothetical protein VKK79_06195, partial [Candidatus Lokiarchaeia archaeon]|nr:hypothetical protein [Candidatus Lokiarchaeia archaeon]
IDSVMTAFSKSLSRTLPRTELIENVLKELAQENDLVGIMLMDVNGITFGDDFKDGLSPAQRRAIREIRIIALKKIVEKGVGSLCFEDDTYPPTSLYGEIKYFSADKSGFYLLVLSEEKETIADKMEGIFPRAETLLSDILGQ